VTVVDPDNGNVTFVGKAVDADGVAVDAFLGIRYADPKMERFAPSELLLGPADADTVDGITDVTDFGFSCPQPPAIRGINSTSTSEDCLYLNVWRPNSTSADPLPVMVWIHGGSNTEGAGSEPIYNGARLAATGNVMVVTLNFRMGAFGFLTTGPNGTGGLNGLLDVITALQWVNHSISSFGGNPAEVTLFGESSGSNYVCLLSVSPLAKGLFKRSIMESGECVSGDLSGSPVSPEYGEMLTKKVLEAANVESVDGLKNLTTEELVEAQASHVLPAMDLWVLPAPPAELFRAGLINPTDMIMGANTFDDGNFAPCEGASEAIVDQAANFEPILRDMFDEETAAAIFQAYSPEDVFNGSTVKAFMQFQGDFQRLCFTRELAAVAASKVDGRVYNYIFGHTQPAVIGCDDDPVVAAFADDPTWAAHGAELFYIFGNLENNGEQLANWSADDVALRREMMTRWANFAKTGNPQAAPSSDSSASVEWAPVPKDSEAAPGEGAVDIPYLFLTGGGGQLVSSNGDKTNQCAPMVRADDVWFVQEDNATARLLSIRYDRGKEATSRASKGKSAAGDSEVPASRKRIGGRQQHLRSQRLWLEESDTSAMLQFPGAASHASKDAGQAGEEL